MAHTRSRLPYLTYCLCDWHADGMCVVTIDYPYAYCSTCHVVGHLDIVAHHILPAGSEGPHGSGGEAREKLNEPRPPEDEEER